MIFKNLTGTRHKEPMKEESKKVGERVYNQYTEEKNKLPSRPFTQTGPVPSYPRHLLMVDKSIFHVINSKHEDVWWQRYTAVTGPDSPPPLVHEAFFANELGMAGYPCPRYRTVQDRAVSILFYPNPTQHDSLHRKTYVG